MEGLKFGIRNCTVWKKLHVPQVIASTSYATDQFPAGLIAQLVEKVQRYRTVMDSSYPYLANKVCCNKLNFAVTGDRNC